MTDAFDWNAAGRIAHEVVHCKRCARVGTGGPPQPFWIGPRYRTGGAVWLGQNPGSGGENDPVREEKFRSELDRFARSAGTGDDFRRWSVYRIDDCRHWREYGAFQETFDGCLEPEEVAWLNVVPVRGDRWKEVFSHALASHLQPILDLLVPAAVVARYETGESAARGLSDGRWQVFALPHRTARRSDRARANRGLRRLDLCGR